MEALIEPDGRCVWAFNYAPGGSHGTLKQVMDPFASKSVAVTRNKAKPPSSTPVPFWLVGERTIPRLAVKGGEEEADNSSAAAHQHILHAPGMSLSADDTAGMSSAAAHGK